MTAQTYRSRLPWSFYVVIAFIGAIAAVSWRSNRSGAIQTAVCSCVLLGLALFIQRAGGSGLETDADGFTIRNLRRLDRYTWENVTTFATLKSGFGFSRATIVTFDTIPPKETRMAGVTRIMTGGHGLALPRNLNIDPVLLADRMNAAKNAAMSGATSTPSDVLTDT